MNDKTPSVQQTGDKKKEALQVDKSIHRGDLVAQPGVVYDFEEVGGYLDASGADTKTAFPKLTSVGGSLDARGADTKTAFPKLTSVGGSLDASGADTKTAFPKLTSVGGSLYASGADTKTAFPKLTSVGGFLYASGADTKTAFPKLTSVNEPGVTERVVAACRKMLFETFLASGFYFADGILSQLVSRRGRVARVIVCGKRDVSYVVEDGQGNYSHGATLEEVRRGLIYKLTSHDTSEFKAWKATTVVSLADAIKAYRAITGACEAGVRGFVEQVSDLPEKLTVAEVIKRTKGHYGADAFAKFFEVKP
jgi:hypothetical protein